MNKKTQKKKLTQDLKEKIRIDFVQGIDEENGQRKSFTLDELIKKYNVAKSTLYERVNENDEKRNVSTRIPSHNRSAKDKELNGRA